MRDIGKKKKRIIVAMVIITIGVFSIFAFNESLTVRTYNIESSKLKGKIRVVFLTDLHSCYYGKGQAELLNCIDAQLPDIILLGGDIVDDVLAPANAEIVLKSLGEKYPCYYVSGNHEYWSGRIDHIKKTIKGCGITILEGESKTVTVKGQSINLCGVDDPEIGASDFVQQIENAAGQADPALFTIFMSHRPEPIEYYLNYDFDLILSGHAHGGQWRIPGILNGLLAPNQGFFPKYAGGRYRFGDKSFVVSRGLAKESTRIPRIFNPPEVVLLELGAGK